MDTASIPFMQSAATFVPLIADFLRGRGDAQSEEELLEFLFGFNADDPDFNFDFSEGGGGAFGELLRNQTEERNAQTRGEQPAAATVRGRHGQQVGDGLRGRFGTRVHLRTGDNNRGKIEIEFYNLDDLERILAMLRS